MITVFVFIIFLFVSIIIGPAFLITGLILLKKYNKNKWVEINGTIISKEVENTTNKIIYNISYIFNTVNYAISLHKVGKNKEIGETIKLLISKSDNTVVKIGEISTIKKVLGITFIVIGSLIFLIGMLFFIPLVIIDL